MTCVKFKLMFKVTKSGAMSPCLCRIKQTQITFLNPQHQTLVAVGLGNTPLESYLCYLGRGSWTFLAVRSSSSFAEFHFDVYACRLPSLLRDDRWCLLVTCKKSQNQWGIDQNNSHHKELIKEVNLVKFLWYDLTCGWNFSSNFCYFEIWASYNVSKHELNETELWHLCPNIHTNKRINRFELVYHSF